MSNITAHNQDVNLSNKFENYYIHKITATSSRGQWVNPSDATAKITQENDVNTIATETMARGHFKNTYELLNLRALQIFTCR